MRIKTESSDEHLPPVPESIVIVHKCCTLTAHVFVLGLLAIAPTRMEIFPFILIYVMFLIDILNFLMNFFGGGGKNSDLTLFLQSESNQFSYNQLKEKLP